MYSQEQSCRIHQKSIIGICVSKFCKKQRACCLKCLNEFHKDHTAEVVDQEDVRQIIENNQKGLEQVLYQINELESVIKVIRLSFESLLKDTQIDFDNQEQLINQLENTFKNENKNNEIFLATMKQIGKYAEYICNFKMDEFMIKENIEKLNQVKQLVKQDGCNKSMKVFENMLASQTSSQLTQSNKIQTLITIIFQSKGIIQDKQKLSQEFHFSKEYANEYIEISQSLKIAEAANVFILGFFFGQAVLISPSLSKTGCLTIKFIICSLRSGIAIGLCKKEIVIKNNYLFGNCTKIGHGFYLNSFDSYTYSHTDSQINHKQISNVKFNMKDIIQMTVNLNESTIIWNNQTQNSQNSMKFKMEDELYICTLLRVNGDSVEIIE